MTIEEFIALPYHNQLYTIGDLGVFQYKRTDQQQEISTFRLHDFFVEVYFSEQHLCITQLRILRDSALLR